MATRDEYEALYREGKKLESAEEGRLPEMAGSTDFYELLGKALGEALAERGKVEILMDQHARVLPTEKPHRITINREELLSAVKSVGWIVDPNKCARTTYEFSRNKIKLSQVSSSDEAERNMIVKYDGPDMSFRLPPDQVSAILSVLDDDEVTMEIIDSVTATVFKAGNFTGLVMPFMPNV